MNDVPELAASAPPGFVEFDGFLIPAKLVDLTGGLGVFARVGREHMELLERCVPIKPEMKVVEIGCGVGCDAIPLTKKLSSAGSYLGIDITRESIDWSNANIGGKFPNFRFHCFDVKEDWYNPDGAVTLQECTIPVGDQSTDVVILQSVFTHMLADDIRHYLAEFRRILKPGGRVYATFFIIDDQILQTQSASSYITFYHEIENGCFVHDPAHPTHAVGYRLANIREMMARAGLRAAEPTTYGVWSGIRPVPVGGQDSVLMEPDPNL
jgi:ubiquinone/menaquinone biosynthesis C-methylase UbiE